MSGLAQPLPWSSNLQKACDLLVGKLYQQLTSSPVTIRAHEGKTELCKQVLCKYKVNERKNKPSVQPFPCCLISTKEINARLQITLVKLYNY